MSYGIAAAVEFKASETFPTGSDLSICVRNHKSHGPILLERFKQWLEKCASADAAFKHYATLLLFYGPLLDFYDEITAYGDGYAREIIYQLHTPLYAQLSFPNYYTECFRHVVNLLAKWPEATRLILQENCSINLSGKIGCAIEMDAYVESEIVKPLKRYASGHTTVVMCERVMGNLDLFRTVKKAYKARDSFNIHHTTRHSVQSSFPDQLKGSWFCLQQEFFKCKGRKEVKCYPPSGKDVPSGRLPANLTDVYEKGQRKIAAAFTQKRYESFPDIRYRVLMK